MLLFFLVGGFTFHPSLVGFFRAYFWEKELDLHDRLDRVSDSQLPLFGDLPDTIKDSFGDSKLLINLD